MSEFILALDSELETACSRKVTKQLALKLAKCIASGTPADLAYAGLLISRLDARVKHDYARLARQIDGRYVELSRQNVPF